LLPDHRQSFVQVFVGHDFSIFSRGGHPAVINGPASNSRKNGIRAMIGLAITLSPFFGKFRQLGKEVFENLWTLSAPAL